MARREDSVRCGNARVHVLAAVHDRISGILPSLECKPRCRGSRPGRHPTGSMVRQIFERRAAHQAVIVNVVMAGASVS